MIDSTSPTIASGTGSHAEGAATLASGNYSHSEGLYTTASGTSSHAGGNQTTVNGINGFGHSAFSSIDVDSDYSSILGGSSHLINKSTHSSILGGYLNYITGNTSNNSIIAGGSGNTLNNVSNTVILGGSNITGTTSDTTYTTNLNIDKQDGLFGSKLGINTSSPQYVIDANGNSVRLLLADTYTGADAPFKGFVFSGNSNNVPQIATLTSNISGGFGLALQMGVLGNNITPTSSTQLLGTLGDTYLVSSQQTNNLNIVNRNGGSGTNHIRMYAGVNSVTAAPKSDFHIQGDGATRGYIGINNDNPSEILDVSGKTKTINFQMTSGATAGYVLTSDSIGNASWQSVSGGTGGVPESTTATTTTINFTGQNIYYNATTPGTGNITENLTGSKLGLIQKIYHNDVAEPTYPAGWVLMGDAIYFTSTLNIIYAEWAFGSRVEYWYVQEQ